MCGASGKQLLIPFVALQGLRPKEVISREIEGSTNVTDCEPKVEIVGEICTEPSRECLVVVRVPLHQPPRRDQVGRGYLDIARMIMSKIQIVVEPLQRPADPGVLI